tara:strand:- start:262188 stop:263228 length:1041 start_codon:yes stop_codon:yes gene_type:complete
MKVLIAAKDPFLFGMIAAYENLGFEVTLGKDAFQQRQGDFDLVHFMWPEVFCWGKEPEDSLIDEIREHLDWWRDRTRLIVSVNNHFPHGFVGNSQYHQLYSLFYEKCHAIHHFSESSKRLVLKDWPTSTATPQLVTHPVNYDHLLEQPQASRGDFKRELGFSNDDFVLLLFGAVRNWQEASLIIRSLTLHRVPKLKVLNAARYRRTPGSYRSGACKLAWKLWSRSQCARFEEDRMVPEAEVHKYMTACDGVIVPRVESLSSGIPLLAMTFGRCIIAPDGGAFRDYLDGTSNLLYQPGSAKSLRTAIRELASTDRKSIEETNAHIAAEWTWNSVVRQCVRFTGINED